MSNSKTDQLYKQLKNFGATGGKIRCRRRRMFFSTEKNNRYFKKIQKLKITNIPFSLFDNNEECTLKSFII